MSAFAAEIELAMAGNFALIEMQTEFHQLAEYAPDLPSRSCERPLRHKARAGFEGVADMQLEGIFVARHAGDAALRPGRVGVGALSFRNHSDRAVLRRLQAQNSARRSRCR